MQTQHHTNRPAPAPSGAFVGTRLARLGELAAAAAVAAVLSACGGSSSIGTSTGGGGGGGSTSTSYVVTTIAGQGYGNYGSTDGPASVATFNGPIGIAFGPNGSLYVGDSINHKIRMIAANGTVSTVAGGGSASSDACNPSDHTVTYGDGPCASATFSAFGNLHIAVDADGSIYVSDSTAVRKVTNPGTASCMVSTLAGSECSRGSADGTGTNAQFSSLAQLKLDASGNVYIADFGNDNVRRITPAGVVTTVAGGAQLGAPQGLVIDQTGNLYVGANNSIRKITPEGVISVFAGSPTSHSGYIDGTGTNALFGGIDGLVFGADGTLYVSDTGNNVIRQISPGAQVTTLAGTGGDGYVNGPANRAQIYGPAGLIMDASGAIYVADGGNNAIRKIAPQ